MCGEGKFEVAQTCFETCLSLPDLPKSKLILVKLYLADVYCELDGNSDAFYFLRAEVFVRPEIE